MESWRLESGGYICDRLYLIMFVSFKYIFSILIPIYIYDWWLKRVFLIALSLNVRHFGMKELIMYFDALTKWQTKYKSFIKTEL